MNETINALLRNSVGVNPWFFEDNKLAPKYPPHRISQIGDDRYRLTMAVAGFTENELEILVQNEFLTVSGKKKDDNPLLLEGETKVLYNGIAFRSFTSKFMIGDVEITKATLKHGLLEIDIMRIIPESKKLKKIAISE